MLIPADAPVYLRINDLEQSWNDFCSTKFVHAVTKLEILQDPAIRSFIDKVSAGSERFEKQTGIPVDQQTIMSILGKQVDLAVVPGTGLPQVILIADLSIKSSILKFMDFCYKSIGNGRVRTENYCDKKLTVLPLKTGQQLTYFFTENNLVVASDLPAGKTCVDILRKTRASIQDKPDFKTYAKQLNAFRNLIYIDPGRMKELATDFPGYLKFTIKTDRLEYKDIFIGWRWAEHRLEARTVLVMPKDSRLTLLGNKQTVLAQADWIPENPVIASASVLDFRALLNDQKESAQHDGQAYKIRSAIQQFLNQPPAITVDGKTFDWMRPGYFFNVQQINSGGIIPVPEFVAGLQLNDPEKARHFMLKIESKLESKFKAKHLKFETSISGDMQYRYVPLPIGPNPGFGYAIKDDYLLISSSQRSAVRSFQAHKGMIHSFSDSSEFKRNFSGSSGKTRAFQFVNTHKLFNSLADIVNTYRIFFPDTLNPDHVRSALTTASFIKYFASELQLENDILRADTRLVIE